jgi:hypothetical protein
VRTPSSLVIEREIERERNREGVRERKREAESEKDGERENNNLYFNCPELLLLFLKGTTGALAPFSYLVS